MSEPRHSSRGTRRGEFNFFLPAPFDRAWITEFSGFLIPRFCCNRICADATPNFQTARQKIHAGGITAASALLDQHDAFRRVRRHTVAIDVKDAQISERLQKTEFLSLIEQSKGFPKVLRCAEAFMIAGPEKIHRARLVQVARLT